MSARLFRAVYRSQLFPDLNIYFKRLTVIMEDLLIDQKVILVNVQDNKM
jgi:hypothetical protein